MTDFPGPQRFDINTLETLEYFPPNSRMMTGCAHWMREPGTDNSITMQMKLGVFGNHIEVLRFTPDNTGNKINFNIKQSQSKIGSYSFIDYSKPEVVATFSPSKQSMVHSFSVTENYAVFFYYPLVIKSPTCFATQKFHIMECVEVLS